MHEPSSTVADSSKLQAAESVHPPPSTSVMQDSVNDKAPPAESENTEFSMHVSKTLSGFSKETDTKTAPSGEADIVPPLNENPSIVEADELKVKPALSADPPEAPVILTPLNPN